MEVNEELQVEEEETSIQLDDAIEEERNGDEPRLEVVEK